MGYLKKEDLLLSLLEILQKYQKILKHEKVAS